MLEGFYLSGMATGFSVYGFPTLPFSKIAVIFTRKKHYHIIKLPTGSDTHLSHDGLCKQCCETVLYLPLINSMFRLTEPVLGDHCLNYFCLSKPSRRGQHVLWDKHTRATTAQMGK